MRRVLIVSPHFPPINAPDHQRVRMALPYLKDYGWSAHILCVNPDNLSGVLDLNLNETIPEDVPITKCEASASILVKALGLHTLACRAYSNMRKVGAQLLKENKFDLIYFSTTQFMLMGLAPRWKKAFGVPYVVDFQDPWFSDYYSRKGVKDSPPGGFLKYHFSQLTAKYFEPRVLLKASHITSVSPAYPATLKARYAWLKDEDCTVLPFGAPEKDFEQLAKIKVEQSIFDPNDDKRHWVYVGRGGVDMKFALGKLFLSIAAKRKANPELWNNLRIHFVGTSYAPKDQGHKTIEPLAKECGIEDIVSENPNRIPYFEALKVLVQSDAILVIGSDDADYSPSKVYPCVLAKRPLLALLHEKSLVTKIIKDSKAGLLSTFNSNKLDASNMDNLDDLLDYLVEQPKDKAVETNWQAFAPYTAASMTEKLCAVFDKAISI